MPPLTSDESPRFGKDRTDLGVPLRFAVDPKPLGVLAEAFVPLDLDSEGEAFIAGCLQRKYRRWTQVAHRLLTRVVSDFDANALLNCHPVFLLSTAQALRLLGHRPGTRLLDIGAGSGDVSIRLAPLFEDVQCTEASHGMAKQLARRELSCWRGEVGRGSSGDPLFNGFGTMALCNVLDRCSRPLSLLQAIHSALPEGGQLLVATPLPFDPFYYRGGRCLPPEENLGLDAPTWELAVAQLVERALKPAGFQVDSLSRVPYLSGGNAEHPLFLLDDAVLVCSKATAARAALDPASDSPEPARASQSGRVPAS